MKPQNSEIPDAVEPKVLHVGPLELAGERVLQLLKEREELRGALIQSRDANCCMSYGAAQVDAVERANRALGLSPNTNALPRPAKQDVGSGA